MGAPRSVRFLGWLAVLQQSTNVVAFFQQSRPTTTASSWNNRSWLQPNGCIRAGSTTAPTTVSLTRHCSSSPRDEESQEEDDSIGNECSQSRRAFLDDFLVTSTATAAAAAVVLACHPAPSLAVAQDEEEEEEIEVYFGCGCFWHVQHELVEAERRILKRSDSQLTARTGYAGGTKGAKDGKVCYHNSNRVSDYGSLGHAEVVRLKIPPSSFPEFCVAYSKLFDKNGSRPDQDGDRGLEYRNLVGFPGGAATATTDSKSNNYVQQLIDASKATGDKLAFAKGSGDDPDKRSLVFIMDNAEYPFFVSEQYHQFHDGFKKGENYPDSYNKLSDQLAKANTLGASGCPKGMNKV